MRAPNLNPKKTLNPKPDILILLFQSPLQPNLQTHMLNITLQLLK